MIGPSCSQSPLSYLIKMSGSLSFEVRHEIEPEGREEDESLLTGTDPSRWLRNGIDGAIVLGEWVEIKRRAEAMSCVE